MTVPGMYDPRDVVLLLTSSVTVTMFVDCIMTYGSAGFHYAQDYQ